MKFSNGCWLQKKGTEVFSPNQVYYVKKEEGNVTLCVPTFRINHRGDTLGGVTLTIKITAPMPEVLRVECRHYLGVRPKTPEFELDCQSDRKLEIEESEQLLIAYSGTLRVEINKAEWKMTFLRGEEKLTESSLKDLAYIKADFKGLAYDDGSEADTFMRERLSLSVGELVYGLGERFTPFVKNGQSVDIWNEDGGTSTEQTYKNIPFYLSNQGYGVFVNHPERVSFEVGSESVKKVQFSVPGESLDYFIINGPTMKDVLIKYTDLTGKPAIPPAWTFGLWLSTSFTTKYDEVTVNSFVDGMLGRGIPLKVFHFDCFWMKEFHWSDFLWDNRVFPDPEGMLRRLKEKGLKICVWINSYIGQESALFQEGADQGYFIKRRNGDVWQWDMWQSGMAIVDFTNPEACCWFASKLERLLDMGVDCFKTDFGERIPTDVTYYDGSDPIKMHNYYTYLYNRTVFELLERKRGKNEAVLFARSATVGGQKFPVHWGGDCWSDYESMAESLRGGLSLTMSGFGFWSHDIGGFENTSTPDVYKRWCAFGLLSTHSRLHGSSSYRVPWAYDEEAVDVVRFFTRLKASLMPYLFANAIETSKTGIPSVRSMILEFGQDPTCGYLDRQYMLGQNLLVAPIFRADGMACYYLPEGSWTNYFTGEVRCGGRWYQEKHGYLSLPLYVRENSILPIGAVDTDAVYHYADQVTLNVYELQEGASIETVVYHPDMETALVMKINKNDAIITIESQAKYPYRIKLMNLTGIDEVSNGSFETVSRDTVVIPEGTGMVRINLKTDEV